MTSANISNLLAKQTAAVSSAAKSNPATNKVEKKDDAQEVFSNLMSQTQTNNNVEPGKTDTNRDVLKVNTDNREDQSSMTSRKENRPIKKADDTSSTSEIKDKLENKSEQFAEDVKDVIEEELDVTEEEIEESMANLGLSMLDLTDPAKLSQLVADLSNSVDQTELLMSDGFQNIMQQVEVLTEQMMQDLGIDTEQLQTLVSEIQQPIVENQVDVPSQEMPQTNGAVPEEMASMPEELATESFDSTQIDQSTEPVESMTATTAAQTPNVSVVTENDNETTVNQEQPEAEVDATDQADTEQSQVQTNPDQTGADENPGEEHSSAQTDAQMANHRHDNVISTENHNVGQFVQTMDATVQPIQSTPIATTTQVDVESIMRQIAEFSKTVINQSGTTLQMQLNPENLGKIYMQISTTKEGNVTAQLAAQNEAVKEALESQVATLRENLNQQGVKVDAIEVTVSTHEFERNLEQNARGEEQQGEQQEDGRRSGRRNLNLDSLDELSGLMSEEEVLAARIMQQNGNSMDVTA